MKTLSGVTPLHIAAQAGSKLNVTILLAQEDIIVDVRTREGNTPWVLAMVHRHCKVAALIYARELPAYVSPAAVTARLPKLSLPNLFAGPTAGNFSAVPRIIPGYNRRHRDRSTTHLHQRLQDCILRNNTFRCIVDRFRLLHSIIDRYFQQKDSRKLQYAHAVEGENIRQHEEP
jgi:hypothetical protein